jgi:hypothetical protein
MLTGATDPTPLRLDAAGGSVAEEAADETGDASAGEERRTKAAGGAESRIPGASGARTAAA